MAKKSESEGGRVNLLLQDHSHFGESLLRNDATGESRFNFLVTVVTAVVGGLTALFRDAVGKVQATPDHPLGLKDDPLLIIQVSLGALLLYALLTYLRMLQKNRVTRDYQETLKYIRNKLVELGEAPVGYKVPVLERRPLPAGLAEGTGFFCAILFSLLLFFCGRPFPEAFLAGLFLFVLSAIFAKSR